MRWQVAPAPGRGGMAPETSASAPCAEALVSASLTRGGADAVRGPRHTQSLQGLWTEAQSGLGQRDWDCSPWPGRGTELGLGLQSL